MLIGQTDGPMLSLDSDIGGASHLSIYLFREKSKEWKRRK